MPKNKVLTFGQGKNMAQISKIRFSQLSEYFGRIDAEFYKPVSLFADKIIKGQNYRSLGSIVSDGYRVVYESTKILKPEQVNLENDARFLQATNISNDGLWIDVEDIGYVSVKDWQRYPKGRIKIGEVLIEVKGQAEKVTIVQEYMPERTLITGSVFKLTLKPSTISHEYLFAFFSSRFGKVLRDRTKVNTLIAYVSKPELYRIPIPFFDNEAHTRISNYVKDSFAKQKLSKDLYRQATQLLDEVLGLNDIKFKKKKNYKARLSEIIMRNRFDSEHFQPKYKQIKNQIRQFKYGWEPFLLNVRFQKPNIDPSKSPNKEFNYVELADINNTMGTINKITSIKSKDLPSRARRIVQTGDVIASSVVGSVEKAALVTEIENDYLASTGFFHFKSSYYSPEFLLMLVKNKLFKEQLFQESTGGILSAVPESNLLHVIIPKFPKDIQSEVTELVKQSQIQYRESNKLLEQAINEVEILIEQAAHQS